MINDHINDAAMRIWADRIYNDWAADFAKRSDPKRVFPLAIIPNTDPVEAAAEVRRCAKLGLRGGDLSFKRMTPPLYHSGWYPLWEAAAECKFPIGVSLDRLQGAARAGQPGDGEAILHPVAARALGPVPARHHGSAGVDPGLRRLREVSRLQLRPGESGVTWLPYVFDRLDTEYYDRARSLNFSLKPSDYFAVRASSPTSRTVPGADHSAHRRGQHHLGRRLPAPRLHLPNSRSTLEKNLGMLSERVQKKITRDNAARLYNIK